MSSNLAQSPVSAPRVEAGSFRDRLSRVYRGSNGEILRALSHQAYGDWKEFSQSLFFRRAISQGKIVNTVELANPPELPADGATPWCAVLEHEKIEFVSYPYEWSFGMLKDAALLQLELTREALQENISVKDATPYNIQFCGSQPVFIDLGSFERYKPGEPWVAYKQFCELFLFPLMLHAYKGVPFHTWLRGSLEGISVAEMAKLLSARDYLRAGTFSHVYLQNKLQSRFSDTSRNIRSEMKNVGFQKELILANIRGLEKLVAKLSLPHGTTTWSNYTEQHSYSEEEFSKKIDFVERAAMRSAGNVILDIGANTGTFSRIAAKYANTVLAADADELAVERMYRSLKADGPANILPLVLNLANLSPAQGWRGKERKPVEERGQPQLTLALALIHHLVITHHIPVAEVVEWFASLGGNLVIEFVTKQDSMVERLLRNKEDIYSDYERGYFEGCLASRFRIVEKLEYMNSTRILYLCSPL